MRALRQKVFAVSLIFPVALTGFFLVWPLMGSPQWVGDCGWFCYVSQAYGDNDNSTYTVEFAGATFTFLYWRDTGIVSIQNGTVLYATDQPYRAYFNIELPGGAAYNITINVGACLLIYFFAPLETSSVEHDGKVVGVATSSTYSLAGKWVFLVSI
jgi:hypothetical protein